MKAVLDTNVWLSAIFWEGEASRIVELAEKGKFEIIISNKILSEIIDIIKREAKFQKFIENKKQSIEDLVRTILSISTLVESKSKINLIKAHASDNAILEAAKDGEADYIVSYNNHVLDIVEFEKIRILTPGDFLKIVSRKE